MMIKAGGSVYLKCLTEAWVEPLCLTQPQTGLPKTLESGIFEILMNHVPYRRIVFPKSLLSIWVNQWLPL